MSAEVTDVLEGFDLETIAASRVVLRKAIAADRAGLVRTQTDPELRRHLGGPRPEEQVRAFFEPTGVEAVTSPAGSFVIADATSGQMLGTMSLARRSADLPGHVRAGGDELELSYLLLAHAWGRGYATEAATALLRAVALALPDEPVLIVTQSANIRSLAVAQRLGFRAVDEFEQFDAAQTLLTTPLGSFLTD